MECAKQQTLVENRTHKQMLHDQILSEVLIHYGSSKFYPHLMRPIENNCGVKPCGGLWTSPVNSEYSWEEFCKNQDFRISSLEWSFKIQLKPNTKVLIIDDFNDLMAAHRKRTIQNTFNTPGQFVWLGL